MGVKGKELFLLPASTTAVKQFTLWFKGAGVGGCQRT